MDGWAAGELENTAISASNLKLKLTEAELGLEFNYYSGLVVVVG